MKQVAVFDKGDHWDVVMDYSGSRRHASLSGDQWVLEFSKHPSYAEMRASMPGITAMMAPRGVGKWKKDWSGPYVP